MTFVIVIAALLAASELGMFFYFRHRLKAMQTQIDAIDPHAGIDAAALERAFNEGVQHIMDYSLSKAMGGGLNG